MDRLPSPATGHQPDDAVWTECRLGVGRYALTALTADRRRAAGRSALATMIIDATGRTGVEGLVMNETSTQELVVEELTDEELDEALARQPVVDWSGYISIDPNVAFGKPVVAGTRLAVEFILDLFAGGWTEAMVLESYPHLSPEALRAVFAYAADLAHERQERPEWMKEPRRSQTSGTVPR
jgi:uncharacterized protein (DUF433 family)